MENGALSYICFLAKLFGIFYDSLLDIMSLFYSTNLLCIHVSMWIVHHDFFVHLEMYMHKSVNFFPWYPRSLPTIFIIHLVFDGVGKNLIYECLFILYCFFSHSYLVNLFGLNLTLISVLILLYSFVLMFCFKWYRGSEDSMFVHIVFKCNKNSNLCMDLGELPYFI
jgi:hypothetical protein